MPTPAPDQQKSTADGIEARRQRAIAGARAVVEMMRAKEITALAIGSLAKGKFGLYSDIDFLVTSCPRQYKYAIEAKVEDILCDLPFDVVYLEEIPAERLEWFTAGAVEAHDLR